MLGLFNQTYIKKQFQNFGIAFLLMQKKLLSDQADQTSFGFRLQKPDGV